MLQKMAPTNPIRRTDEAKSAKGCDDVTVFGALSGKNESTFENEIFLSSSRATLL